MQYRLLWILVLLARPVAAAEYKFDFSEVREGQLPPGFRSTVTGEGKPGDWKVIWVEAPSAFPSRTAQAPAVARQAVLAQLARDPTDEHFPLLIFQNEVFGDFTFTTRFKLVAGDKERMAGVAFRIQNETNYYVVRASSLGSTFRFYKVVNGERSAPLGPEVGIASGVWHELTVQCKGNQIRCLLNGKELIPLLTDNSFGRGKIGFWTKSDSVSYFADAKISYTRRELPAQTLLRDIQKNYPRLLALKIYVPGAEPNTTKIIASKNEQEDGQPGGKTEQAVISQAQVYYGKETDSVSVIAPLRDRNGEAIAAVRVVMKPFKGQTEQNAIIRALPIVKEFQERVQSLQDLVD
jgi:3-keto-disaccharide hydrolase